MGNLATGMELARREMEKIKNLALTESQVEAIGDIKYPPLSMNDAVWFVERDIEPDTDPLKIWVKVYLEGEFDKPLCELVTLFEDRI